MLKRWSDAIIASGEFSQLLAAESITGNWAGFPAARAQAIAETERRLKLRLPDSYREFLKISNGWWLQGTAGPLRLWSVEEIQPMADIEPEIVAIWSKSPTRSTRESDTTDLPSSHFRSVIQISEENDGRYLLNPLINPQPEEWQAAFFAPWVPGAECHESFQHLMFSLGEAFIAAHSSARSNSSKPARNLAKPPAEPITDPRQFIDELQRLGFFRYVSAQAVTKTIQEFYAVSEAFVSNGMQPLDGRFASPGAVILGEESGRVANLDVTRLAKERGRYAIGKARQLIEKAGIEIGSPDETTTADSYSVRIEGITHEYFRLRKGHPALSGGEHEDNAARYVLYETAKALNKVLKHRERPERFATLEELQAIFPERGRLAIVLLDDDLSYLLMWSPVIHNYCRPLRPDVFR